MPRHVNTISDNKYPHYYGNNGDTRFKFLDPACHGTNNRREFVVHCHTKSAYPSHSRDFNPWLVRGAYGVSWAYILGDVGHEGWKAYKRNQRLLHPKSEEYKDASSATIPMPAAGAEPQNVSVHIPAIEDYRSVMAQRAVFQSVASMGLPAFTIHSIVKYSGKALKTATNLQTATEFVEAVFASNIAKATGMEPEDVDLDRPMHAYGGECPFFRSCFVMFANFVN